LLSFVAEAVAPVAEKVGALPTTACPAPSFTRATTEKLVAALGRSSGCAASVTDGSPPTTWTLRSAFTPEDSAESVTSPGVDAGVNVATQ
jgi:hypothetical protein